METLRIENQALTANVKVQQGYFDRSQADMDNLKAQKALQVQEKVLSSEFDACAVLTC